MSDTPARMRAGHDYIHRKSHQRLRSRWQARVGSVGNSALDLDRFPWLISKVSKPTLEWFIAAI